MAKSRTIYSCSACGAQAAQWAGQCGDCGGWNTLTEVVAAVAPGSGRFAGSAFYSIPSPVNYVNVEKAGKKKLNQHPELNWIENKLIILYTYGQANQTFHLVVTSINRKAR